MLALTSLIAGCGGSLYKVKPKVDAPIVGGKERSAGGFTLNGTVTTTNVQFTGGSFVGANTISGALVWVAG